MVNRNKDVKGLVETIKSQCYHSNSNRHPCVSALSARVKLCNYFQQEGKHIQDYAKELKAIHDVVKAIDGGKGVGIDGEAFEEVEKRFQIQHCHVPSNPTLLERHNTKLAD